MTALSLSRPRTTMIALKSGGLEFDSYLNTVEEHFNKTEPDVLAFLPEEGRFDRLRKEAQALIKKYPYPDNRPELFGLLIGVKDIFHTRGFLTKAGSNLPPDALQGPEAVSVTKLKEAGALVMGKTVTTEFAYFAPGPTRNPHNPEHTPGGSSSGSAAAVAANLVPLAFGTQTIGSIIRPASFCGVFGYKPSYDRISRQGVIPLSKSFDHVGFFSQNPQIGTMVAKHLVKNWEMQGTLKVYPTLAIPTGPYLDKVSDEMQAHFKKLVNQLEKNRFKIKEIPTFINFEELYANHQIILSAEAASIHKNWFNSYAEDYHERTAELIEKGKTISHDDLDKASEGIEKLREDLAHTMEENQIDLWIAPSALGPAPKGLDNTGDPIMNLPWTQAGLPAINIPAGVNQDGLPLGLQIIGCWYQDENLFAWSSQVMAGIQ